MTVDFKEYSRRMDKALEHLDVSKYPWRKFESGGICSFERHSHG